MRPATVRVILIGLLIAHALLLGLSIPRNAVTIDEVAHLPAGIAYWQRGEFWGYHHNPPLVRLLFALPPVLADVPIDYSGYYYRPGNRQPDSDLGRSFMLLNQRHYMAIFGFARTVTAALSVLGGYFIFCWSRELFGDAAGLLSVSLWVFCPNVLAHGGLVTPDVGSTVIGFIATYQFWKYLRTPSYWRVIVCGILLGLTEAAKFSFVVLPFVWGLVALVSLRPRWADWLRAAGHAILILCISLVVLNDVYLGEGSGRQLRSFEFRSPALTRPAPPPSRPGRRENRFLDTPLARVPVPLPEQYVLGFDAQMWDVTRGRFYKYLRGELRRDGGWWYYYVYCMLVKTPVGTLVLLAASVLAIGLRGFRSDFVSEAILLPPALVFLVSISSQTGLNSHLRYVLPAYPFLFVFAGRLGRIASANLGRMLLAAVVACNVISVLRVHPHYLAYFNEPAGGPANGLSHLADSNIDWGQGLIALRDWLDENAPGQKIQLAYFGTMYPEVLGIDYEVPPFGPAAVPSWDDPRSVGPVPGLHAIGANYLLGIPFPTPDGTGEQIPVPLNAYTYYRHFKPVATPGWSIYVYDLSLEEVNRVRRDLGLPLLSE